MRRLLPMALVLGVAAPARAAIFDLHVGVRLGGATGTGLGGAQKDNDFFAGTKGGTFGALVGLQILFIDVWAEHDQLTDFSSVNGTWTQFMAGPHIAFGVSEKVYADLGAGFGFGLGTGQQIDPPLDNAQVSDKGFMVELRAGLEYRMTPALGLGVSLPIGWGYMFKNDVPANDVSSHYQTFRAMLVGTLTIHAGF